MATGLSSNRDSITTRQISAPVTGPASDAAGPPSAPAINAGAGIEKSGVSPVTLAVGWLDTDSSHRLRVASGENLSADRTLTLILSNAARTLTISGTSAIDQDVRTTGTPQFARLGLGVAADATSQLYVSGAAFPPLLLERTTTATNTLASAASIRATTSNDMVDGFAAGVTLRIRDNAGVDNTVATIAGARAGADNTGDIVLSTAAAGVVAERARLTSAGVWTLVVDRSLRFNNQTSSAGASTGTLTNAPAAGNPGFWLRINIGGTNYAIPCWAG